MNLATLTKMVKLKVCVTMKKGSLVVIDVGEGVGNALYIQKIFPNLIKALQHMQKYLVDEGYY